MYLNLGTEITLVNNTRIKKKDLILQTIPIFKDIFKHKFEFDI